jgi:pyruvate dehydrogenase E1 component beta subunit
MSIKTYVKAVNEALGHALRDDPDVFLMGEDIEIGLFQATSGLIDEFGPNRVRQTPITEAALAGAAVGAALMGARPVLEIQFADILGVAFDHVVQSAAKMRYIYAGKNSCPMVVRAPQGMGMGYGMHHSQCVESWFANVPGLQIVTPSTPYDAKGLLYASIKNNDPVIFLEHKKLYWMEGEVPDECYSIPLGKGDIKRAGKDVTVVATGQMVPRALEAAEALAVSGPDVEVLDPRTIRPLDTKLILDSVARTGRLLVVHESAKFGGIGGEIAAVVAEEGFEFLKKPVVRLGGREIPIPFGLEEAAVVQTGEIEAALRKLCH